MQGWAAPGRAGLAPPPNGQWALGRDPPASHTHVNMRWALHWTPGHLSVNRELVTRGPVATSPQQRALPRSHTRTDARGSAGPPPASLVAEGRPPYHSPRALWLSGPRSSHRCSRGAFCSPGMLPAERILRKHKVPGAGPRSPPQVSHRSLLWVNYLMPQRVGGRGGARGRVTFSRPTRELPEACSPATLVSCSPPPTQAHMPTQAL